MICIVWSLLTSLQLGSPVPFFFLIQELSNLENRTLTVRREHVGPRRVVSLSHVSRRDKNLLSVDYPELCVSELEHVILGLPYNQSSVIPEQKEEVNGVSIKNMSCEISHFIVACLCEIVVGLGEYFVRYEDAHVESVVVSADKEVTERSILNLVDLDRDGLAGCLECGYHSRIGIIWRGDEPQAGKSGREGEEGRDIAVRNVSWRGNHHSDRRLVVDDGHVPTAVGLVEGPRAAFLPVIIKHLVQEGDVLGGAADDHSCLPVLHERSEAVIH